MNEEIKNLILSFLRNNPYRDIHILDPKQLLSESIRQYGSATIDRILREFEDENGWISTIPKTSNNGCDQFRVELKMYEDNSEFFNINWGNLEVLKQRLLEDRRTNHFKKIFYVDNYSNLSLSEVELYVLFFRFRDMGYIEFIKGNVRKRFIIMDRIDSFA